MTSIAPITTELKTKAKPKDQSVYIRAKHCEAKVEQRVKFYDTECTGFYVSVTPNGAATFIASNIAVTPERNLRIDCDQDSPSMRATWRPVTPITSSTSPSIIRSGRIQ